MARGRTRTVPTHKEKGSKSDHGQDQSYFHSSDGKRVKKNLANVYKILSANTVKNTYQLLKCNQMYSAFAANYLDYYQSSAGNSLSCPIHAVDLTACPNMQSDGTIIQPSLNWCALTFSDQTTSGVPTWTNIQTSSLVGSPLSAQQAQSYPGGSDQLAWSEIKLNLYAAKNVPITFKVMFVQFKKAWLVPNAASTGTTDEIAERAAFWQAMLGPLTYNPIVVQNSKHLKDVNILKQDAFHLTPKRNTDGETAPNIKTVSYFERWNRDVNYAWQDEGDITLTQANAAWQVDTGVLKATAEPTKRVYMLITAESFNTYSTASPRPTGNMLVTGTYDLLFKNRHVKVI